MIHTRSKLFYLVLGLMGVFNSAIGQTIIETYSEFELALDCHRDSSYNGTIKQSYLMLEGSDKTHANVFIVYDSDRLFDITKSILKIYVRDLKLFNCLIIGIDLENRNFFYSHNEGVKCLDDWFNPVNLSYIQGKGIEDYTLSVIGHSFSADYIQRFEDVQSFSKICLISPGLKEDSMFLSNLRNAPYKYLIYSGNNDFKNRYEYFKKLEQVDSVGNSIVLKEIPNRDHGELVVSSIEDFVFEGVQSLNNITSDELGTLMQKGKIAQKDIVDFIECKSEKDTWSRDGQKITIHSTIELIALLQEEPLFSEVLPYIKNIIPKYNTSQSTLLLYSAFFYETMGNLDKALSCYNEALSKAPKWANNKEQIEVKVSEIKRKIKN